MSTTFYFSPTILNVPADSTILLQAVAVDRFPDREPARSPIYRIKVLGVEQHADLVRQKLESLLARLEEITRLEEKLLAETEQLQEAQENEELDPSEAAEKLAELSEEQLQNARQLEQIAREGMQTLREALRNPAFSEETLSEWTKNLQAMNQLAQSEMPSAASSLQAAGQNESERAEKLEEASQKEQEILDALAQMQQQVNEDLDQLQALTLAQRLRRLSGQEKRIGKLLEQIIPETIGLMPHELPTKYQEANSFLAAQQSVAQEESEQLQGEISRFFERTQSGPYGEVSEEMAEARTGEEMEELGELISSNISMQAMQDLASWSARFEEWADKLSPNSGSGEGGAGSGGASGENQLLKQLMSLLRLRESELNLREQTRLLEKRKPGHEQYEESAQSLLEQQQALREKLTELQGENPLALLDPVLQDTHESMESVESFLSIPQTDEPTDQAETQTIELLSDAINLLNENSQQGNSSGQSAASQQMAFLMQMMAPSLGSGESQSATGGGNLSGGSTDQSASSSPLGDASGRGSEERRVSKSTGLPATVPSEFRQALEKYYEALEQE